MVKTVYADDWDVFMGIGLGLILLAFTSFAGSPILGAFLLLTGIGFLVLAPT